MTNTLHHIFIDDDLYEILVRGSTITTITKFCGDSQLRRVLDYDDLPPYIQSQILNSLTSTSNAKDT